MRCLFPTDCVVCLDRRRNGAAIASLGEWSYTPIWNAKNNDMPGVASSEAYRARKEYAKVHAIFLSVAATVLIVDSYQQRDQRERTPRVGGIYCCRQLVSGPAGSSYDDGIGERSTSCPRERGELRRPTFVFRDAFAHRVGIAERQKTQISGVLKGHLL